METILTLVTTITIVILYVPLSNQGHLPCHAGCGMLHTKWLPRAKFIVCHLMTLV